MKITLVFLACILLMISGCKSTSVSTVAMSDVSTSVTQDSCYDVTTVRQDSVKIKADTASAFLPYNWINDTTGYKDPAPMQQKQGRATIKIERQPGGVKVTASCDSLLFVLFSREREILKLRREVTNTLKSKMESDKQVRVMMKIPPWLIIALLVSIAINVLIIYLNIKKRVL
jgi:hypothetical protein